MAKKQKAKQKRDNHKGTPVRIDANLVDLLKRNARIRRMRLTHLVNECVRLYLQSIDELRSD